MVNAIYDAKIENSIKTTKLTACIYGIYAK